MEPTDHFYINFVIFVDFSFFYSFDQFINSGIVILSRGEELLSNAQLHKSLVDENVGDEYEFLITNIT